MRGGDDDEAHWATVSHATQLQAVQGARRRLRCGLALVRIGLRLAQPLRVGDMPIASAGADPGSDMRRRMLKSKIHRATVTGADVDYAGSISLDPELMGRADVVEWEQVAVLDVDNGSRFETYAMRGDPGEVRVNGAAARLVEPGHRVIVLTYGDYGGDELAGFSPVVVLVDAHNRPLLPAPAS